MDKQPQNDERYLVNRLGQQGQGQHFLLTEKDWQSFHEAVFGIQSIEDGKTLTTAFNDDESQRADAWLATEGYLQGKRTSEGYSNMGELLSHVIAEKILLKKDLTYFQEIL